MAIDFEIEDRKVDDDTHVVAVSGEIDLFTAPEFKQRMSAPIDAGRSNLVVDLTRDDVHRLLEPRRADRRAPPAQAARRRAGGRLRQRGDRQDVQDHRARRRLHARADVEAALADDRRSAPRRPSRGISP